MMIKKIKFVTMVVAFMAICQVIPCMAEEKATPEEVYELILRAVPIIEELGEDGLDAFNDPNGEFVYKDTYVLVIDCAKMLMVAHPNKKFIGMDLKNSLDRHPDPAKQKKPNTEMCAAAKKPNGGWTDFYWVKLGEEKAMRKINFSLGIPGTDYTLVAGIYDETTSVEELNAQLK